MTGRAGRPQVRLTTAQVRYVRRARAGGVPMLRIAKTVGICRCTLYRVLRRMELAEHA